MITSDFLHIYWHLDTKNREDIGGIKTGKTWAVLSTKEGTSSRGWDKKESTDKRTTEVSN